MEQSPERIQESSQREAVQEVQRRLVGGILLLFIPASGLIWTLVLPSSPYTWPQFITALILFGQFCLARYILNKSLRAAKAMLLLGPVLCLLLAIHFFDLSTIPFLAIVVVVANAAIDPLMGLGAAILCSVSLYTSLQPGETLLALLILIWLVLAILWLSSRSLHTVLAWAWSSQLQASDLLAQLRERQGKLNQTLIALTEATSRLQRTGYELALARMRADEARRLKEQFAANISHELRTPLNLIVGFSTMMHLSPEVYGKFRWPATLRRDVKLVHDSSRQLLDLINDVLDLSRIDATQMPIHKERSDLSVVIQEAVSATRELLRNRTLELRTELQAIPPFDLDRTRIRQVLLNLLNNSARFTEAGSITVRAEASDEEAIVSVADTGVGIPPEEVNRVFDEFHQVDMSLRRRHEGAGLGLAISKRFIELHGGRIWAESEVGQGSTFYFTLPLSESAALEPLIIGRSVIPNPAAEHPSLIVVDGDPEVGTLLERYLHGLHVVQVAELSQVGNLIEQWHPRALLVNVAPGEERRARALEQAQRLLPPKVPLLICSLPSQSWLAADAGVRGCLTKPVSHEQLLQAVAQITAAGEVLIVDDDWGFVQLITRFLEQSGAAYRTRAAASGEEALALIAERRPDVLLLDLMMPGMDGLQFLDALRQTPDLGSIPVLIVTATSYSDDVILRNGGAIDLYRQRALSNAETIRCLQALLDAVETEYPANSEPTRPAVGRH